MNANEWDTSNLSVIHSSTQMHIFVHNKCSSHTHTQTHTHTGIRRGVCTFGRVDDIWHRARRALSVPFSSTGGRGQGVTRAIHQLGEGIVVVIHVVLSSLGVENRAQQRWEFIKENKKVRKKRKHTLNQESDQENDQEKQTVFLLFLGRFPGRKRVFLVSYFLVSFINSNLWVFIHDTRITR